MGAVVAIDAVLVSNLFGIAGEISSGVVTKKALIFFSLLQYN